MTFSSFMPCAFKLVEIVVTIPLLSPPIVRQDVGAFLRLALTVWYGEALGRNKIRLRSPSHNFDLRHLRREVFVWIGHQ